MLGPACKVVFADLDRKAGGAVRGVDLPAVLHDLERLVSRQYLIHTAGQSPPGTARSAQERLTHRVIIRFDALNLDLAADPGHGVNADPPVNLTCAHPMPDGMAGGADLGGVGPSALERLCAFWPAEFEWLQAADMADLYIGHVASLKGERPPAPNLTVGQSPTQVQRLGQGIRSAFGVLLWRPCLARWTLPLRSEG